MVRVGRECWWCSCSRVRGVAVGVEVRVVQGVLWLGLGLGQEG